MMKDAIHVSSRMPDHESHPTRVCSVTCLVFLYMRKKMNLADTDAYREPTKMIVGIMKLYETFLKVSSRAPNAGAVTYWPPV